MISSLLYIGAGIDVDVTKYFPQVEKFILIDIQPRSEHDRADSFDPLFYRDRFYPKLIESTKTNGFTLIKTKILDTQYYNKIFSLRQKIYYTIFRYQMPKYINPTLLTFRNDSTNQTIKYYISTNIHSNMNTELERDIRESDGLIVSGHNPNDKLLEFIDIPKIFYGSNTTYFGNDYEYDPEDSDYKNIISWLYKNSDQSSKYFSEFNLVDFPNKNLLGTFSTIQKLDEFNQLNKIKEPN